LNSTGN